MTAAFPASGLWALLALPRSKSTAVFRAMTTRSALCCIHEPFCSLVDFGRVLLPDGEGGEVELRSVEGAVDHIRSLARRRPVFLKETTDNDLAAPMRAGLCRDAAHVAFLVRDPDAAIRSHLKMRSETRVSEFGFGHLREAMDAVAASGARFAVLRAEELDADPRAALSRYCALAGLPWSEDMLRWEPEDRPEWRDTRRWHRAVAESTGLFPLRATPADRAPADLVASVAADYEAIRAVGQRGACAGGACRCGSLRYSVLGEPPVPVACDCPMCRRLSGGASSRWAVVDRHAFVLSGSGAVERPCGEGFSGTSCETCGTLVSLSDARHPDRVGFSLATLDGDDLSSERAIHTSQHAWPNGSSPGA